MIRRALTVSAIARMTLAAGASACVALAVHSPVASPHAQLRLVDGTLSQSNSKSGAAILSATDMRPGESTNGSVTIANTGSAAGDFTLSSFGVTDVPGRGGGLMSTALVATVLDVTDPATPRQVYTGSLGAMTTRALGTFEPGTEHTYDFSVGLPDGGAGLDGMQGGTVTIGYRWTASTSLSGDTTTTTTTPPAPPTPPPTTEPPVPPVTTTPPTPPPPGLAPFSLKLTGKGKWSARKRRGPVVTARCSRVCSLRAAVKVRGMKRKLALKVRSKPMASATGRATRFQIVLKKKATKKIRRAIKRHKRIKIAVTVTAVDQYRLTAKGQKLIRVKR
jgi:spore coat-associated protein N